jgi:NhaA family Na+:H+ antiporter
MMLTAPARERMPVLNCSPSTLDSIGGIVAAHARFTAMSEAPPVRLDPPVHAGDHALGRTDAEITLLEYGSYNCPFCHRAHDIVAGLRDRFGDRLRYVFRHRPITGNEEALRAAHLAEYAARTTDQFWHIHDRLMKRGPTIGQADCDRLDAALPPQAEHAAEWAAAEAHVAADRASAARSGALYSPTFYINGRRYDGAWDETSLAEAMLGSLGHRVHSAALDFARWAPSTGLLLLLMTLLAMALANSPLAARVEALWAMPAGFAAGGALFELPLREWINDGLLTIFFFVVGLEIKREFTIGRLATRRAAALPFAAALGGMLVPALLYLAIAPERFAHGWAIPTTTDTAFAIAIIALLGHRVPVELRIFLTAAVIVDDLAAIAIVALFYSEGISPGFAVGAALVTGLLIGLNRGGVYRPLPYALGGIALWACLHASGLHATLAGVILAALTPTRPPPDLRALLAQAETVLHDPLHSSDGGVLRHGPPEPVLRALDAIHDHMESPAAKLLRAIEPWSSYFVLPLFALANAGLQWTAGVTEGHGALIAAIVCGLVLGKPLGMLLGAWAAVRLGIAEKPAAFRWSQLAGAGALAGIGFTMSLYIAAKGLPAPDDFAAAKLAVFIASLAASAAGIALLAWSAPQVDERDAGADEQRGERKHAA